MVKWILSSLLLAGMFHTPAVFAAKDGERYQDWTVSCVTIKKTGKDNCTIFQNVVTGDDKKQIILRIVIAYVPKQDKPAAIITVPLGVLLRPGVQMKIDKGKPIRLPIDICMPVGCQTGMALDSDLLKSMLRGNKMFVSFFDALQKQRNIPVSLNGFTAALNSLK